MPPAQQFPLATLRPDSLRRESPRHRQSRLYDAHLRPCSATTERLTSRRASGIRTTRRRCGGVDLLDDWCSSALQRVASAERQLPGLLDEMREVAYAADPLLLYSRLTMLAAMRRAMPGEVSSGSDAVVEFFGGLVTGDARRRRSHPVSDEAN